ncbi:aldo/keto reductase [Profundibacterium mesophilum]|uniref:1-deoxy-D-xylulose-5-phosphate reductoisomerase n=1 Tax=Profundibacterium mesophilum KAUST100406-0324 TaxID=1037889 RepID=A0A921NR91_9RHOB|nr:aldo/keto reductase [Profundibacterium mesophilum]KAF0677586.1 1-deoxy-D-xylulose-5-phosphate reductoisomerase [Profundibacterium mesophilum KAUST100406-0324]
MKRTQLGRSGIEVSQYCLGTMTWGTQNTQAEGHEQIDRAREAGIDFLDTAEMYPVNPVSAETVGRTEEIVGNYIAERGRGDLVIASKVSGKNGGFVRDGEGINGRSIREALEASLKRLKADCIDLYQLHWPNRGSYHFRQIWGYDPSGQDRAETLDNMAEVMDALCDFRREGKIRAFGLSNETAWGTVQWNGVAEAKDGPRVETVQNEYSLLCRLYDSDMAETAVNEGVTLLAYSPLAAGLLSGKYQGGACPDGSRMSLNGDLGGRKTDRVFPAIEAYLDIARRHGLDPVQMALAWTVTRPFHTVPILGATGMDQLETALGAASITLSGEVIEEIETAHKAHPMPY